MILNLVEQCSQGLVERRTLVEAIVLAAVAGEHVLVVGPPGTAKSEAARRVARGLGGRYFEYLLGKFSEPSELFGPVDMGNLRSIELAGRGDHNIRPVSDDGPVGFVDGQLPALLGFDPLS